MLVRHWWSKLTALSLGVWLLLALMVGVTTVQAATDVQAPGAVLIINQVRGPECCDLGSFEAFKAQVEYAVDHRTPSYFALRYDALIDPSYINYIKQTNKQSANLTRWGIFIEVTPNLAKAAQVPYPSSAQTWYQAQQAFTIGYQPADRRKLVDTLVNQFEAVVGTKPQLSVGWLTDTPTLNYLHDQVGIQVHELTREQWGTDSYLLDGGPPHYPYPASRSWAFMPDFNQAQPLTIVRQTVTDPLFNYGDSTSAFTSQPNDYARDHKNISYFKSLINQAFNQSTQPGFAVIGLENSMPPEIQHAYQEQLDYLNQLQNEHKLYYIDSLATINVIKDIKVTSYCGKDLINNSSQTACWITSPAYRIRLRLDANNLYLDDFRIFNSDLTDPYASRSAQSQGYWLAPYVIDGARFYASASASTTPQSSWAKLFGIPEALSLGAKTKSDTQTQPTRLAFPAAAGDWTLTRENENIRLNYQSKNQKQISLLFQPRAITSTGLASTADLTWYDFAPSLHPVRFANRNQQGFGWYWHSDDHILAQVEVTCQQDTCTWLPAAAPDQLASARVSQYPWLFPEVVPRQPSAKTSQLYAHNHFAIAGKNPVRVVILARDEFGFPISLTQEPTISTQPAISPGPLTTGNILTDQIKVIDLYSNTAQKTTLTVSLSPSVQLSTQVVFAPNCRAELGHCLTHPIQAWWYLRAVGEAKLRALLLHENQ